MQIYQPGRRRVGEDGRTGPNSPTEKSGPGKFDDFEVTSKEMPPIDVVVLTAAAADKPEVVVGKGKDEKAPNKMPSEKRVSRYSERRNKVKERLREQKQQAVVEAIAGGAAPIEKLSIINNTAEDLKSTADNIGVNDTKE